jgi:hypothetical protein
MLTNSDFDLRSEESQPPSLIPHRIPTYPAPEDYEQRSEGTNVKGNIGRTFPFVKTTISTDPLYGIVLFLDPRSERMLFEITAA